MKPRKPFGDFDSVDVPDAPWTVYQGGKGPPVLLLQELPGFTPSFLACAQRLRAEGFSVWMPVLAGPVPADTCLRQGLASLRICVSREIHVFARGATSPVVTPLRALARHAVAVTGARGAGVVGMCFTGGFALALAADEPVLAGVASQPSLPIACTPLTRHLATDLGLSAPDEAALLRRLENGQTGVYVTRFSEDRISPAARAREIERRLGVEVDDVPSPARSQRAHSVLTYHGEASPGERARIERTMTDVVAFLRGRLSPA